VRSALASGADADAPDPLGRRPLHLAVVAGLPAAGAGGGGALVVAALLAAGADPGAPDGAGNTPLHYAVGYNAVMALPTLVRKGDGVFDLQREEKERERGTKKKRKGKKLTFFPKKNSKIKLQLSTGNCPFAARNSEGLTALDVARASGKHEVVEMLLGFGG
jgi:ankyrin repeat protein